MAPKTIGTMLIPRVYKWLTLIGFLYAVFVTGNPNKLREVQAVLEADQNAAFTLTNQDFDREGLLRWMTPSRDGA